MGRVFDIFSDQAHTSGIVQRQPAKAGAMGRVWWSTGSCVGPGVCGACMFDAVAMFGSGNRRAAEIATIVCSACCHLAQYDAVHAQYDAGGIWASWLQHRPIFTNCLVALQPCADIHRFLASWLGCFVSCCGSKVCCCSATWPAASNRCVS